VTVLGLIELELKQAARFVMTPPAAPRSLDLDCGLEDNDLIATSARWCAHRNRLPEADPVSDSFAATPDSSGLDPACNVQVTRSQGEEAYGCSSVATTTTPCCSSVNRGVVYASARPTAFRWAARPRPREPRACKLTPHSPRGARSPPCWPSSALRQRQLVDAHQWVAFIKRTRPLGVANHALNGLSQSAWKEGDNLAVGCGWPFPATAWLDRLAQGMTIHFRLILMAEGLDGRTCPGCAGHGPCVPGDQAGRMGCAARRVGDQIASQIRSPQAASMPREIEGKRTLGCRQRKT